MTPAETSPPSALPEVPAGGRLLVHACCAPCSTVAWERLRADWHLTFFFYGPNIHPRGEYRHRLREMQRYCAASGVELVEGEYRPGDWGRAIRPFRHLPEGSERCQACFYQRLEATASEARRRGYDAFTATLTVSRHKRSAQVLQAGRQAALATGVPFLEVDLKKRGGFERSLELSRRQGLYRQHYCGCSLSLAESLARARTRARRRS